MLDNIKAIVSNKGEGKEKRGLENEKGETLFDFSVKTNYEEYKL